MRAKVITAESASEMNELIAEYIGRSWIPQGGIATAIYMHGKNGKYILEQVFSQLMVTTKKEGT